jgi:hypothetical protein
MICGRRVRVEMSTGKTRHDGKERYGRGDRYNSGYRSGPPRGPPRREYGRDSRREGRDNDRDEYRRRRYSRYKLL